MLEFILLLSVVSLQRESYFDPACPSGGYIYNICVFSLSPSGILAQERKLCRDLVHSNKKEQEFRSIFHHIQSAQSQRSPSELFAQHIVTIVHHVRGEPNVLLSLVKSLYFPPAYWVCPLPAYT